MGVWKPLQINSKPAKGRAVGAKMRPGKAFPPQPFAATCFLGRMKRQVENLKPAFSVGKIASRETVRVPTHWGNAGPKTAPWGASGAAHSKRL